jgi:hypothetical protein
MKRYWAIFALILVMTTAACDFPMLFGGEDGVSPTPTLQQDMLLTNPSVLRNRLSIMGLNAEMGEAVMQPFLQVPGQILHVNGEDVQVYEYANEAAAAADAVQISPDGSLPTIIIDWISTPHFYRFGNLIVLYVGTNSEILAALESILGSQFAEG